VKKPRGRQTPPGRPALKPYSAPPASESVENATAQATAAPLGDATVDSAKVAMAALALTATLIVGLLPDRVAAAFFLVGVIASAFLLRRAFPSMWLYSLWLLALYVLAFIAATLFTFSASVTGPKLGPVPVLLAGFVVFESLSAYVGLSLFAEVKSIRDFRTRLSIARGDRPLEYRRIGLWTLALLAFFAGANLSAVVFVGWVRGNGVLLPFHAAFEALLIGLGIYLLMVPESAFGRVPPEFRDAQPAGAAFAAPRERRPACPACGGPLTWETRACPNCARTREVGWCPTSEAHVVECPHCGRPVLYGKAVCPHCRSELPESLQCAHCAAHAPLRDWKPASAA
jgi:hypothetical protein